MIVSALPKLINHEDLSQSEAEIVMNQIMSGDATPAEIGAYLTQQTGPNIGTVNTFQNVLNQLFSDLVCFHTV